MLRLITQQGHLFAECGTHYGLKRVGAWSIKLSTKFFPTQVLELGSGEDWRDRPVYITISKAKPDMLEWMEKRSAGIGVESNGDRDPVSGLLGYNDGEPQLFADLYIPSEAFESLISFAQAGRFPTGIDLNVLGLNYSYSGYSAKWPDNKHRDVLPITNFRYEIGPDNASSTSKPTSNDRATAALESTWLKASVFFLAIIAGTLLLRGCH